MQDKTLGIKNLEALHFLLKWLWLSSPVKEFLTCKADNKKEMLDKELIYKISNIMRIHSEESEKWLLSKSPSKN